jgi:hypothetical protein
MSKSPHRASDGATGAEDHSQQKRSTRPSAQLQSEKNPAVALRHTTDEAACRFLQLILPEEGPYIAWIKESNEQKYNVFMSTISQLWVVIKRANDAGDEPSGPGGGHARPPANIVQYSGARAIACHSAHSLASKTYLS